MLNNVPTPGQSLGASRGLINANFSTTDTAFSVDHVAYNDSSGGQGKHNKVTFPVQSGAPSFSAGQDGLYNLLNATTAKNELYIHRQTFAGTSDTPFTASILSTSTPTVFSAGWTYLPSGLILKWAANVACVGSQLVNFPTGGSIPAFTTCLTVIPQIADGGAGDINRAVILKAVNPTNFTVYVSPRTTTGTASATITYWAIGY